MPRKIAAGNWKMNGTAADKAEIDALAADHPTPSVDIVVFHQKNTDRFSIVMFHMTSFFRVTLQWAM